MNSPADNYKSGKTTTTKEVAWVHWNSTKSRQRLQKITTLEEWKHTGWDPHLVGFSSEASSICLVNWTWSSSRRMQSYWAEDSQDRGRVAREARNWGGDMREEKATGREAPHMPINSAQILNWPLKCTCAEKSSKESRGKTTAERTVEQTSQ